VTVIVKSITLFSLRNSGSVIVFTLMNLQFLGKCYLRLYNSNWAVDTYDISVIRYEFNVCVFTAFDKVRIIVV